MITFFVHSSSVDNENNVRSGWQDCSLSDAGRHQALELGRLVAGIPFDAVFCSDLCRATETVDIAFAGRPIRVDSRLREMNYGEYNGTLRSEFPGEPVDWIDNPFPGGECALDVERRIKSFLDECLTPSQRGRGFPPVSQLAREVLLNGCDWHEALAQDWREAGAWQPGWTYRIVD